MVRGPIAYYPPPVDGVSTHGVGIEVQKGESGFFVASANNVESEGDICVGDLILSVDGVRVESKSWDEINGMIRGPPGTKVLVCLASKGKEKRYVNLTRMKGRSPTPDGQGPGQCGNSIPGEPDGSAKESEKGSDSSLTSGARHSDSPWQSIVPKLNFSNFSEGIAQNHATLLSESATSSNGGLSRHEAQSTYMGEEDSGAVSRKPSDTRVNGPADVCIPTSFTDRIDQVSPTPPQNRAGDSGGYRCHAPIAQRAFINEMGGQSAFSNQTVSDSSIGLVMRQTSLGSAIIVEKLLNGPVYVAGIISVGDELLSVSGKDMRGKSLQQAHAEMQAPPPTASNGVFVGLRRNRGGVTQDYWVSLPLEPMESKLSSSGYWELPTQPSTMYPSSQQHQSAPPPKHSSNSSSHSRNAILYPLVKSEPSETPSTRSGRESPREGLLSVSTGRTSPYELYAARMDSPRFQSTRNEVVAHTGGMAAFAEAKWRDEGNKAMMRVMEHLDRADAERARKDFDKAVIYYQNCRAKDMNRELGRIDKRIVEIEKQPPKPPPWVSQSYESAYQSRRGEDIYYTQRAEEFSYVPQDIRKEPPVYAYHSPQHSPRERIHSPRVMPTGYAHSPAQSFATGYSAGQALTPRTMYTQQKLNEISDVTLTVYGAARIISNGASYMSTSTGMGKPYM